MKSNKEIKRAEGHTWDKVPLDALSNQDGHPIAARVPPWIATLLNQRHKQQTQQLLAPASAPTDTAAISYPTVTAAIAGNTAQQTIGPAAAASSQDVPAVTILASQYPVPAASAAAAQLPAVPTVAVGPAWVAASQPPASAPEASTFGLQLAPQSGIQPAGVAPDQIVAHPQALGVMLAQFLQHLQMHTAASYAAAAVQQGDAANVDSRATGVAQPEPAAAQPPAAGSPAAQAPCTPRSSNSSWTAINDDATYSSVSPRNTPSATTASSGGDQGSKRQLSVSTGFKELLGKLLPPAEQKRAMKASLNAICKVIQHDISETCKMEWKVTEVIKAGSFAKGTSLKSS